MGSVFLERYDGKDITRVFPAEDLARLVKDSVDYYEQYAKRANERADKTRTEVKAEITNEYEDENRRIRNKLKYAVAILESDVELDRYKKFCDEHKKCLSESRANWGRVPYVRQVGTGIGTATTVVCQVCGKEQDITDINQW